MRILFCTDGSEHSINAISRTLDIMDLKNFKIDILTVKAGVETLPIEVTLNAEWLNTCIREQDELAINAINSAKDLIENKNYFVENTITLDGNAADEIIEYLKNDGINLIVLGSHGRSGFVEFIIGSTSKKVLEHAKIPVLIVPFKK